MDLGDDPPMVHLDSWGLKRLFTRFLKCWMSGASKPRDSGAQMVQFEIIFDFHQFYFF